MLPNHTQEKYKNHIQGENASKLDKRERYTLESLKPSQQIIYQHNYTPNAATTIIPGTTE